MAPDGQPLGLADLMVVKQMETTEVLEIMLLKGSIPPLPTSNILVAASNLVPDQPLCPKRLWGLGSCAYAQDLRASVGGGYYLKPQRR